MYFRIVKWVLKLMVLNRFDPILCFVKIFYMMQDHHVLIFLIRNFKLLY